MSRKILTDSERIRIVIDNNPSLNPFGWDYRSGPSGTNSPLITCGWPEDIDVLTQQFVRSKRLFREIFERCTRKRLEVGSYALKHHAEENRLPRKTFTGFATHCLKTTYIDLGYVSNGVCIAAAIDEGLKINRVDKNSPNCIITFNLTDDQLKLNRERYKREIVAWRKDRRFSSVGVVQEGVGV